MPLPTTPSPPYFRLPTTLEASKAAPRPAFQAPLQELFEGEWYMLQSSNSFWKDKRNVRLQYTSNGSYIEDKALYQMMGSDAVKSMDGKDTPSDTELGVFTWRGKGLLRVASAQWEVLCFTSRPEGGDWMLVYAHKSIFTSPALNLLCRTKGAISTLDLTCIKTWLQEVEDDKFQQTVAAMIDIAQQ